MRSVLLALLPLLLCFGGCGLVLDLDAEERQRADAGSGVRDAGHADGGSNAQDGEVPSVDASRVDAPIPLTCGDAFVDEGEECDDGNDAEGDGCENDCTYSCLTDAECSDGNRCTGTERCDLEAHLCVAGGAISCPFVDACHTGFCDPEDGCVSVLSDGDGDGHASTELGACGTDCNDSDPGISPDATERCDALDHDCDGSATERAETAPCYADEDLDGYGDPDGVTLTCEACDGGTIARAGDCYDINDEVHPRQTLYFDSAYCDPAASGLLCFDYDCDGIEELRWPRLAPRCSFLGALIGCAPGGWVGEVPACGDGGTWQDCEPEILGLTCRANTTGRKQECR